MSIRLVSIVKSNDGETRILVEKDRRGQKRTVTYHRLSPASRSRWQRVAWNCPKVMPFFTLNHVGFTLYLPGRAEKEAPNHKE